jgi:hypothetical protein
MFNLIAIWIIVKILYVTGGILAGVFITRIYQKHVYRYGLASLVLLVSALVIDGKITQGLLEVAGLITGG